MAGERDTILLLLDGAEIADVGRCRTAMDFSAGFDTAAESSSSSEPESFSGVASSSLPVSLLSLSSSQLEMAVGIVVLKAVGLLFRRPCVDDFVPVSF